MLRAYIQKVNNPPVHKFISICGPNNGVGTCPDNILYKAVCPLWKISPYKHLAFSDYWKDVTKKDDYLKKSNWLADMNNERDTNGRRGAPKALARTCVFMRHAHEHALGQRALLATFAPIAPVGSITKDRVRYR